LLSSVLFSIFINKIYGIEVKKITITIDGPAASGKSTTAKLVAKRLGYLHIDTGAMYRAFTLKVLENRLNIKDDRGIVKLMQASTIRLDEVDDSIKVLLDGEDVTMNIRTPEITRVVSVISSYQGVREVMVNEQRKMALNGGVVLEGRDIGTVVFPQAELKIFMIANIEERSRRRQKENELVGIKEDIENIIKDIETRDRIDSTRESSPLRRASDAIELDTSNLTIQEQVDFIVNRAKKIINSPEKG
jgi:cytidylate kinase